MNIPSNCSCVMKDHIIPRRGHMDSSDVIDVAWLPHYNISDTVFDFEPHLFNDSTLIDYIAGIGTDFINLKEKMAEAKQFYITTRWVRPVQLTHLGVFSFVMITMLVFICLKCYRKRRDANLRANLRGNHLSINALSLDGEV